MTLIDPSPDVGTGQIVPVIDVADALGGDPAARRRVAEQVDEACREIGFFCISGHGVDPALLARVVEVSDFFFSQPEPVKQRFESPVGNRYRGWSVRHLEGSAGPVPVREHVELSRYDTAADLERAGYGPEWIEQFEPNIWPSIPEDLEEVWKAYFAVMDDLGVALLSLMAEALRLPREWFADKFDRQSSYLSVNRYPAPGELLEGDGVRFTQHTDIGSLTLLYQDDGPGPLQVLDRRGRWCDVPYRPGTYIVNLGDLLAKWTNDRWVATPHRVLTPPPEETRSRISVPYFQHPNFDALIECLPTCREAEAEPRYPAVLAGNWAEYRFQTYDD
jgi:isopenicillin N synthase-like dioxygenase